jgi:hypothetical protein
LLLRFLFFFTFRTRALIWNVQSFDLYGDAKLSLSQNVAQLDLYYNSIE